MKIRGSSRDLPGETSLLGFVLRAGGRWNGTCWKGYCGDRCESGRDLGTSPRCAPRFWLREVPCSVLKTRHNGPHIVLATLSTLAPALGWAGGQSDGRMCLLGLLSTRAAREPASATLPDHRSQLTAPRIHVANRCPRLCPQKFSFVWLPAWEGAERTSGLSHPSKISRRWWSHTCRFHLKRALQGKRQPCSPFLSPPSFSSVVCAKTAWF